MKTEIPRKEEDKYVQYHDSQKQLKVPFVMYADFESILESLEKNKIEACTERLNNHVPSWFCVYSKFTYAGVPDPLKVHRGKDCIEVFVDHISVEVKRFHSLYPAQPMVTLTDILQREHDKATECYICKKSFDNPERNWNVRDHCHYTGLYKGAAHNNCNLKYKILKIPVEYEGW